MAQCTSCGAENKEGAFTCAGCGEALGPASRPAAPAAPAAPAGPMPPMAPMAPMAGPPGAPQYPPAYPQAYPQGPQAQYPPAYGMQPGPYQQPYPVVVNAPTSSKAVTSLVLGIVGIFICPLICSVLAMVIGRQAKEEIARSMGTVGGYSLANAGYILGVIGLVIYGLFLAFYIVIFIIAASSSSTLMLPLFM